MLISAARSHQQAHRFGGSGRFVQEGGVGDFHAGEVDDHGLEIQQGFEAALGNLGLVGRVGGIPTRILQNVALDHGRGGRRVVALADVGGKHLVFLAQGIHMAQVVTFTHGWSHIECRFVADGIRNRLVDQFVDRIDANSSQHVG